MAQIISGKETSSKVLDEIAEEVKNIKANGGKVPHLAAIIVGEDGASQTYVASKVKACEKVGFGSTHIALASTTTQEALIAKVEEINNNKDIDGLIVQLPLPDHIDPDTIIQTIVPEKDVDGFHPANVGRMVLGLDTYVSATPHGIMELLKRYNIATSGKHCVVIGRSNIVGTPVSILMSRKGNPGDATVTLCHSRTQNLKEICASADILIVAIGRAEFLTADMVKEGATIIDVGIHRIEDATKKSGFRLVGDVKFDECAAKATAITPVPGGVGPMTIASLLTNTLKSAKGEVYSN